MDLDTQTHLTTLRELLNYRLMELRADVHAARLLRSKLSEASANDVADTKDEAAQRQSEAVDDAQERRDIDELAEVEAALVRLDAGVYGNCADCGEPIALQRLRVQPATRRCAACQGVHEGSHSRSR